MIERSCWVEINLSINQLECRSPRVFQRRRGEYDGEEGGSAEVAEEGQHDCLKCSRRAWFEGELVKRVNLLVMFVPQCNLVDFRFTEFNAYL